MARVMKVIDVALYDKLMRIANERDENNKSAVISLPVTNSEKPVTPVENNIHDSIMKLAENNYQKNDSTENAEATQEKIPESVDSPINFTEQETTDVVTQNVEPSAESAVASSWTSFENNKFKDYCVYKKPKKPRKNRIKGKKVTKRRSVKK